MKNSTYHFRHRIGVLFLTVVITTAAIVSCSKDKQEFKNKPSSYPAVVIDKWITLQLRLMRNATGIANHAFSRHFAYSGIAALESLAPGFSGHEKWNNKWNGLAGLPAAGHSKNYYFPANVNAALATINRLMFPGASATDKAAIDSLESALKQEFLANREAAMITTSSDYGKAVANAVFAWSETDGFKNANNAYTIPTGAGLWKPTPPAFANPATPYWGNNRTIMVNSIANTAPAAPPAYTTEPGSPFYQVVKQVYDASQNLTDDQKAMAIFWRDVPGVSSPGHWLSILQQVVRHKNVSLDKAALAYALVGTAVNDALITCFKAKYQYNVIRPVTYIREVMGQASWTPYLGTPATPEYVSAHSSLSAAAAHTLQNLLGYNSSFTDHTYDYMGFAPRNYPNLVGIAMEAGHSRLYAGIHYQFSIDAGLLQGKKVAENILAMYKIK